MNCPGCGAANNVPLLNIDEVPASNAKMFATQEQAASYQVCRLDVVVCQKCAHIWNSAFQQSTEDLYDQDYYSSFTKSAQAQEYQENLASVLNETVTLSGKTVLEIGCGDGYFLSSLMGLGAKAIGYEPSSTYELAKDRPGLDVVNDFFQFDGSSSPEAPVDIVVMRHVLEHMESPRNVLTSLRTKCFSGDSPRFLLLEVPNVNQLLQDDLYFDFYNDHVQYFSHPSLDSLARSSGWTPVYRSDGDDEFIRLIWANEQNGEPLGGDDSEMTAAKKSLFAAAESFRQDFQRWKGSLVSLVSAERAKGNSIAAWGAGARGVGLLAGLGQIAEDFSYVVDSDPNKWGKFLPMSGLPVSPQERIAQEPVDCVLITSYTYFDEIWSQLEGFRAKGGRVMKVYPTPELVT